MFFDRWDRAFDHGRYSHALLSRETENNFVLLPRPRSKKLGSEARQVKQNYFSLSGQNGRRVTKAHLHVMVK